MFRQPINATFTLSEGAVWEAHTCEGIMVMAEAASAEFFRKFLLDGFIMMLFFCLLIKVANYKDFTEL